MPVGMNNNWLQQLLGGFGGQSPGLVDDSAGMDGGGDWQGQLLQLLRGLGIDIPDTKKQGGNARQLPTMQATSAGKKVGGATGGGMQVGPPNFLGGTTPAGGTGGGQSWSGPGGPNLDAFNNPARDRLIAAGGTLNAGNGSVANPDGSTWYPYGVGGSTISGGEVPGQPGSRAGLGAPDPNGMVGSMTNAYMAQRSMDASAPPVPYQPPRWQRRAFGSQDEFQQSRSQRQGILPVPNPLPRQY